MDPLSITLTCVTLIGAVSKTSGVVTNIISSVRGGKSELDGVLQELQSLTPVLEMLADDTEQLEGIVPDTLKGQITGIATNCMSVVAEIERMLQRHESAGLAKAALWATSVQRDIARLRSSLEAHKSALEIALDMVALTLARDIKADTSELLEGNSMIKQDTAQILEEIIRLQTQMTGQANQTKPSGLMLERYLDNLSSYAESVCGTFPDSMSTDDETEPSAISESEVTSRRSLPSVKMRGGQAMNIESSNTDTILCKKEYSTEDDPHFYEWQSDPGDHREKIIRNVLSGATYGAMTGELRLYTGPKVELLDEDWKHHLPQARAQPISPEESALNWINDTYGAVEVGDNPMNIPKRGIPMKKFRRFGHNLILDCPVPVRILKKVAHAEPPERDEFTHVRYSALTCRPSSFSNSVSKFVLRASIFAKPRSTNILIAIPVSENDLSSPAKRADFARTLRSAIQNVGTWNRYANKDSWKYNVVGIISDGTVEVRTLLMLQEMGIWNDFNYKPSSIDDKDVRAHLYEYTTQLMPQVDKLEIKVVVGEPWPGQMILCLQEEKYAYPTQAWAECFGTSLKADVCVMVVPGMIVSEEKLRAIWESSVDDHGPRGYKGPKIIPYPENWL